MLRPEDGVDRRLAVVRHVDVPPRVLQDLDGDELVDVVVFRQEELPAAGRGRAPCRGGESAGPVLAGDSGLSAEMIVSNRPRFADRLR